VTASPPTSTPSRPRRSAASSCDRPRRGNGCARASTFTLAAGIGSMFLTPLLVRAAPHITAGERLLAPLERLIGVRSIDEADQGHTKLEDHVVIVGYGLAGRFAARTLAAKASKPRVCAAMNSRSTASRSTTTFASAIATARSPPMRGWK